jgi:hypothetical protein
MAWRVPLKPPWLRRRDHRQARKDARRLLQLEAASRRLFREQPHGIRVLALRDVGLPTWHVDVGGTSIAARMDSCSTSCVGNDSMATMGTYLRASRGYVEGVTGNVLPVTQVRRVEWSIPGGHFMADVHVVPGMSDQLLLGSDFMAKYGMDMLWSSRELSFTRAGPGGVRVPFTLEGMSMATGTALPVRRATVARRVNLPAMCGGLTRIQVAAPDGTDVLFTPFPGDGRSQVLMAATVSTVQDGVIIVPAVNTTGHAQRSRDREAVGLWTPLSHELQVLDLVEVTIDAVDDWLASVNATGEAVLPLEETIQLGHLDTTQRQQLLRVLRRFPELTQVDAFVLPAAVMGVEHSINTGLAPPTQERRTRLSPAQDAIIRAEIIDLLRKDLIEPASGAWGFPVVIVKKKDGSARFCIDYRRLNAVTVRDVYPLPRIDETLEQLGGAKWFTTLDLSSGYWQIPMCPDDMDKTAFTSKYGLYRWRRMPMGLCNAPATFQRAMDAVLRGLTWQMCLVYLDDIIVYTNGTFERHLLHVALVLRRLRDAGLTLKFKKCVFAATEVEYLGHLLTADGVKPNSRLLDSLRRFPEPRDEKQVRSFVHLAGYYRRFIADFASKAAPLTKLTRKAEPFRWESEQQAAFDLLKKELCERPVLRFPDFTLPFTVVCDASLVGLGAALMQDDGDGMRPVAFISHVNSVTQAKYGITELECLAVVWALKAFRPYVYGRRVQVITDHNALVWLMSKRGPAPRLHRWALQLADYDMDLVYRPGHENVVADALSRMPVAIKGLMARARPLQRRRGGSHAPRPPPRSPAPPIASGWTLLTQALHTATTTPSMEAVFAYMMDSDMPERSNGLPGPNTGSSATPALPCSDCGSRTRREPTAPIAPMTPTHPTAPTDTPTSRPERLHVKPLDVMDSPVALSLARIRSAQETSPQLRKWVAPGALQLGHPTSLQRGLWYVTIPGVGSRVLLPPSLWHVVLREAHDSALSGHLGFDHTLERVRRRFWWPGMARSARVWASACKDCGSRKPKQPWVVPPLRPLAVGEVGARWALDLQGPYPTSLQGNVYVLAATEYVTRTAVTVAIPNHSAVAVARAFWDRVCMVYGLPAELLMDGASELTGRVLDELCRITAVEKFHSVAYRPAMMGLVERFNRTIKDMVAIYVSTAQNDWDEWLPTLTYAYNTAVHSTHGFPPMQLMMGRIGKSVLDLQFPGESIVDAIPEWNQRFVTELRRVREIAKTTLQQAQTAMARRYDKSASDRLHLRPGMWVWIARVSRDKGVSKLKHRFRGPARLVEAVGFDNWRVECLWDHGAPLLVHASECLPFFDDGELQRAAVLDTVSDGEEEDSHLFGSRIPPDDIDDGEKGSLCQVLGLKTENKQGDTARGSVRQKEERARLRRQLLDGIRQQADWCGIRRSRRQTKRPLLKTVMEVEVYSTSGWCFVAVDAWEQERHEPSGRYWVPWGARGLDGSFVQTLG